MQTDCGPSYLSISSNRAPDRLAIRTARDDYYISRSVGQMFERATVAIGREALKSRCKKLLIDFGKL